MKNFIERLKKVKNQNIVYSVILVMLIIAAIAMPIQAYFDGETNLLGYLLPPLFAITVGVGVVYTIPK